MFRSHLSGKKNPLECRVLSLSCGHRLLHPLEGSHEDPFERCLVFTLIGFVCDAPSLPEALPKSLPVTAAGHVRYVWVEEKEESAEEFMCGREV